VPYPVLGKKVLTMAKYPLAALRIDQLTNEEKASQLITEIKNNMPNINPKQLLDALRFVPTESVLNELYEISKKNPDTATDIRIINTYLYRLTTLNNGKATISEYTRLTSKGLEPNDHILSTLIGAYARAEQIDKAHELLEKMKSEDKTIDARAYKEIMRYYFKIGEMRKAFAVYDAFIATGAKPDIILYNELLKGYRIAGWMDKIEQTFKEMKAAEITPDRISHTERVLAYGRGGTIEQMILKLQEMKDAGWQPTHVTYNAMCWIFIKKGMWENAFAVIDASHREKQFPLDAKALKLLAEHFADLRRFDDVRWLIELRNQTGKDLPDIDYLTWPQYGLVDKTYWERKLYEEDNWPN